MDFLNKSETPCPTFRGRGGMSCDAITALLSAKDAVIMEQRAVIAALETELARLKGADLSGDDLHSMAFCLAGVWFDTTFAEGKGAVQENRDGLTLKFFEMAHHAYLHCGYAGTAYRERTERTANPVEQTKTERRLSKATQRAFGDSNRLFDPWCPPGGSLPITVSGYDLVASGALSIKVCEPPTKSTPLLVTALRPGDCIPR
jgi:hypothetical protein